MNGFATFMEMLGSVLKDSYLTEDQQQYLGEALFEELYYHPSFRELEKNVWHGMNDSES